MNQNTLMQQEENLVVKDGSVDVVVKNVKKNVKKNARHEKKREKKREKRERVENKYLVKILYNIYNIYMPRSKSRSPRVKKVENYKKPKEEHQELNEGFDDDRIKEARENQQPRALFKLSNRHGYPIEHSIAKRTLKVDKDDKAKTPVGSTRKTHNIRHGRTRLVQISNPSYRKPTPPKKKSCCERWFRWGSKKRKKKCKKKCKTRKKKSKTLKKKRRRRKMGTRKR